MQWRSTPTQWGMIARSLHWLMGLGLVVNGGWGLWMTGLAPSMHKINIYALHKSIGLTLLALACWRLIWRGMDRRPRELAAPRWQQRAAKATHLLLYGLMLAIPLSGWWFNSAAGYPLQWFKQFSLPSLGPRPSPWAAVAQNAHQYLFWLLIVILVIHLAAAIKHHLIDRDDTLQRMLPWARRNPTQR